jgi:fructose-1-phosphate kinase PfkB-like protein
LLLRRPAAARGAAVIHTLTLNPAVDRELRVPAIAFGEVLRATGARVDSGGKGFNVSRALKALGEESVALGFVGPGPTSPWWRPTGT